MIYVGVFGLDYVLRTIALVKIWLKNSDSSLVDLFWSRNCIPISLVIFWDPLEYYNM